MARNDYWSDDEARLFIQRDGPGTALEPVVCVDVGDSDEPQGDMTRETRPDPRGSNKHMVAFRGQGSPGETSLQFTLPRFKAADVFDELARRRCPVSFYYLQKTCGRRDAFLPFTDDEDFYGYVAKNGYLTTKGRTGQMMRHADQSAPAGTMRTYTLSYEELSNFFKLSTMRRVTAEDQILCDIWFYNEQTCGGPCGDALDVCEIGAISSAGEVAVEADILLTTDGGVTWTAAAAQPFAVAEDAGALGGYNLGAGNYRVIVCRATTDGANPAEIGYSDDAGATWSTVNVGATNGEFMTGPESMFQRTPDELWICTDTGAGAAGAIYRSRDGALTWTQMMNSATDALNSIKCYNERVMLAVGDTNEILATYDGGDTWTSITGPAAMAAVDALCCAAMTEKHWLVGYEGGQLYQTQNGGISWEAITLGATVGGVAVTSVDAVRGLHNLDDHCVFATIEVTSGGNTFGVIMRSVTGGESGTWESFATPVLVASTGLQGVHACHYDKVFGVGGVATTGMILEASHTA